MATHSSILAWRISWIEEPGRLRSIGSQRVRHDCVTNTLGLRKGTQERDELGRVSFIGHRPPWRRGSSTDAGVFC